MSLFRDWPRKPHQAAGKLLLASWRFRWSRENYIEFLEFTEKIYKTVGEEISMPVKMAILDKNLPLGSDIIHLNA